MADQPLGHSTNPLIVDTSVDRDILALTPDGNPRLNRWFRGSPDGTLVFVDVRDVEHTIPQNMNDQPFLWAVKTIKSTSTCTTVAISW